jgi:hypothetical protein
MTKNCSKVMPGMPEVIREQFRLAQTAANVKKQDLINQMYRGKMRLEDAEFARTLEKLPKGCLENSSLKNIAKLKPTNSIGKLIGKAIGLLKHIKK